MEIRPCLASDLEGLTLAYNRTVQPIPHCYPIREKDFAAVLSPVFGEGQGHPRLHSEAAFVASEGRAVTGFIHTAVGPVEMEGEERGSIRFFWYDRGRRATGQALLEAAETELRGRGMNRVEAVYSHDSYPFYSVASAYLTDHLEHVQALLKYNDYVVKEGEVILDWMDYESDVPVCPLPDAVISLEWEEGKGERPNLKVRAHLGEQEIGECVTNSFGEFTSAEEAQDWVFVDWLGVDEQYQGAGLGRYLLQRNLQEMKGAGYRHASITTIRQNHRALLFYSNYGFQRVDWTYSYERDLDSSA